MTDAEKKVLEGFLSKTLKMDTEGFANLYNEAGELVDLTIASETDASRVKKLKEDGNNQYKRGLKEGAGKIEAELKDKYDIESDLIGVELFEHILTKKMDEVKGTGEDVTKHPEFLKLKLETDKLLKAKDKEWQKKLEEQQTTFNKQLVFSKVKDRAIAELENLKPILPEDSKKAMKWKEKFIDEISRFEYQEQDGTFVPLKEGKPITDSHGYSKTFADHIKDTAEDFFEFQAAEPRSSTGQQTNLPPKAQTIIKDKDDYIKRMREAKTPEDRIKVMESFTKNK